MEARGEREREEEGQEEGLCAADLVGLKEEVEEREVFPETVTVGDRVVP